MNKFFKVLGDENGASVVLVALSLLVIFCFAAVVVDYGAVALERREMVTAADAGALAGARILLESNGDPSAVKAAAKLAAENYAVNNGAQPDLVEAEVIDDYYFNGSTIQVIVVSAGYNKEFFFSRAVGSAFNDIDVMARGVASWGYVTSLNENFLPLFVEADQIPEEIPGAVPLHIRNEDSSSNWGIFNLSPTSDIGTAIRGFPVVIDPPIKVWSGGLEDIPAEYIYTTETGKMSSIVSSLDKDNGTPAKHGRLYRNYVDPSVSLTGFIPIVEIIAEKTEGQLDVVVRGFAPYEIQDVVVDNDGNGSKYATNLGAGKIRGTHNNVYDGTDFPDYRGSGHNGTIIGRLLDPDKYYYVPSQTTNLTQTGMGLKYSFLIE